MKRLRQTIARALKDDGPLPTEMADEDCLMVSLITPPGLIRRKALRILSHRITSAVSILMTISATCIALLAAGGVLPWELLTLCKLVLFSVAIRIAVMDL
jgi:hypothetical protein